MKRLLLATAALAALCLGDAATAQTDYRYDWRSGNSYTIERDEDSGEATVDGRNRQNGTAWRNTVDEDGNQRGVDSAGNRWRYNRATGTYRNSDGTECSGRGTFRSCTDSGALPSLPRLPELPGL